MWPGQARGRLKVPEKGISFRLAVEQFERDLIIQTLRMSKGVQKRAAELLGLKPTTFYEMIKRYGISSKELR